MLSQFGPVPCAARARARGLSRRQARGCRIDECFHQLSTIGTTSSTPHMAATDAKPGESDGRVRDESTMAVPLAKLRANLAAIGAVPGEGKEADKAPETDGAAEAGGGASDRRLIVLLSTGALNPVHVRHVEMFDHAKTALEAGGATVVGGFLSPSHDKYVRYKLGRGNFAKGVHRAAMLRMALAEHTHLDVCTWELEQDEFVDFPYVLKHVKDVLGSEFPGVPLQLVYLCGWDLVERCRLHNGVRRDIPVCGVGRAGHPASRDPTAGMCFRVEEAEAHDDVSSTMVRERIARKEPLTGLLHPDVESYIYEHKVLGAQRERLHDFPEECGADD